MKFDSIRNIQFTKLIKVNGQLKEFNFRKSNSTQEGSFSVDVSDDRGLRVMFSMAKDADEWKITNSQPLPVWVTEKEKTFNDVILEELK